MKTQKNKIVLFAVTVFLTVSLACGGSTATSTPVVIVVTATSAENSTQLSVNTAESAISTDTPLPTEMSVPAVTNTPKPPSTPKPSFTPTLNIPPLEILSYKDYTDGDWFHIVGEVRNNSNVPMQSVKIIVTLYDQNHKVSGTDFTYTELDVIPPGGKSPFETGTDKWEGTTSYELQVQGREGELPRQELVILSHESYEDNGWLHVRGEVKNTGETEAKSVMIIVTLYDVNGLVVGFDFTYAELDTIPPGETSPFETGTDRYPNFDHYEIQVQGR